MLCWIIPIIVGLICALLGYLLGKRCACKKLDDCESIRENMRKDFEKERSEFQKIKIDLEEKLRLKTSEISGFQSKFDDCESLRKNMLNDFEKERSEFERIRFDLEEKLKSKENEIFGFQSQIKDLERPPVPQFLFDEEAARLVFGKKIKEDDLTIVEGIGPKIQELFKENGISTWKKLSETSVERLKEILTIGGERFIIHNPGTWPRQAELAYQGKWQELKEWQDFLVGGVEPS
ncbi:hypothetical protein CAPN001_19510 [Capnocytophaga stomatis]|uniref:hypothetical protein n=1 Tax=Capnocytophaga stomatis TaxID=1848904 RepID=UPI001951228D|nr:hypothetical protein [Capnocytophaga stomatis]GIJ94656.1 hypothetical protein CAPN002_18740 [Capnocytophaga stomatis]GIJ97382.1 hypothetical protein CAPN001_19510 [Capnocytophaga stomatis]